MNTLTRLVLIPEDEYFRLKNENVNLTDKIVNSNLTDTMKVALSNEIDHLKVESQNKMFQSGANTGDSAVEIPKNLLEHMENKEDVEDDYKARKSPKSPKVERKNELNLILRSMDYLIDKNGAILNDKNKPIIGSDINEIVEFFSKKLAKKRPIGTKRVLAVIKEQNIPIADLIANKNTKDYLTRQVKEPTWETLSRSF